MTIESETTLEYLNGKWVRGGINIIDHAKKCVAAYDDLIVTLRKVVLIYESRVSVLAGSQHFIFGDACEEMADIAKQALAVAGETA